MRILQQSKEIGQSISTEGSTCILARGQSQNASGLNLHGEKINCTLDSRSDRDESINRKRGGGASVFARICPNVTCLLRRARTFRGKALYDDAWDKTVDLLMAQVVGTRVTFKERE